MSTWLMSTWKYGWGGSAALLWMALAATGAHAACRDFSWNVHRERALFAGESQAMRAASAPASAPRIHTDQLYALNLSPQQQVRFEVAPGKKMLTDNDYAGVVQFAVPESGNYRVSLDRPFWIDVIADGKLLPTQDFQGQRGCEAPHKIVEFTMPAHQKLWLQFSGASAPRVRVSITKAPAVPASSP